MAMDEIQTVFGRIEAERVVMLLDTCYSGAAGGRTFAARRTRATSVDDLFLERLTRSKGRAIMKGELEGPLPLVKVGARKIWRGLGDRLDTAQPGQAGPGGKRASGPGH